MDALWGAIGIPQGPIRTVYLPIKLNGNVVCISEGSNQWLVTNANLKAGTTLLSCRKSKKLDDKITPACGPIWESRVTAFDEVDGWIRVELTEDPAQAFSVVHQFEKQAPKAFGDVDFFVAKDDNADKDKSAAAPPPSTPAAAAPAAAAPAAAAPVAASIPAAASPPTSDAGSAGLKLELKRLETTMIQMHSELASERGFRQEAAENGRRLKDMTDELDKAEMAGVNSSKAANSMVRELADKNDKALADLKAQKDKEIEDLRKEMEKLKASADDLKEARAEAEAAKKNLRLCEGALINVTKDQNDKNARREARQQAFSNPETRDGVLLASSLVNNISREMRTAKEGMVLEKVDQKHNSKQERLCAVDDETGELKWAHFQAGWSPLKIKSYRGNIKAALGAHEKVDMKDVIRIEYGRSSRAFALFKDSLPWLCFSLYTTDRSFDFICPDEWAAQSFVLVISRLCPQVNGAINSRRKFVSLKGWCKVQDLCLKSKKSLARILVENLNKRHSVLNDSSPTRKGGAVNPFSFAPGAGPSGANPFTFVGGASPGGANPFTFNQPRPDVVEDDEDEDDEDDEAKANAKANAKRGSAIPGGKR